jgi:hypothetical protein
MTNNQRLREVLSDQLKDHVAEQRRVDEYTELHVHKPGTGFYSMWFLYKNGLLIVWGDCYDAIYQWHSSIGAIEDVARCDLDYFASKCLASPYGRGYRTWNYDVAEEYVKGCMAEEEDDKRRGIMARGLESVGSRFEWNLWLSKEGYEVFEPCDDSEIGMEIDIECVYHLAGLKLAFGVKP